MKSKRSKAKTPARAPVRRSVSPYWYYGSIVLVILFFAFIRFRLRDFPLERDEGEYAYVGQLILQGIPPYKLAYNMKLPGTYAAYSAILAVFGQTAGAIHCGLLLMNAATTFLVYLLGARLFGRLAGVVACASFALMSTSQAVLGTAAHATHFVILPALAGMLLLLQAIDRRQNRLFLSSGILLGLAFIMKQPGALFVLGGGLYIVICELRRRPIEWKRSVSRAGVFFAGAIAPFALTCLILFEAGVFDKFWFWTFSYAREYATATPFDLGLREFEANFLKVAAPCVFIWSLAALGLTAFFWHHGVRHRAPFVVGLTLFSFLAVCPGLYFRPHYFILLLPASAILAGLAVHSASEYLGEKSATLRLMPALAFVLVLAYSVSQQGSFFFDMDPATACQNSYGANPFPQSLEVAKYIRNHTSESARIAVLGSEPQIYFYSGRHSATGYIYTYSLMEVQKYALKMQQEMIDEIEKACPEYIVFVNIPTSWTWRANSERLIFSWAEQYAAEHYVREGIVDIDHSGRTEYRWGEGARSYEPRSDLTLVVLRRKGA